MGNLIFIIILIIFFIALAGALDILPTGKYKKYVKTVKSNYYKYIPMEWNMIVSTYKVNPKRWVTFDSMPIYENDEHECISILLSLTDWLKFQKAYKDYQKAQKEEVKNKTLTTVLNCMQKDVEKARQEALNEINKAKEQAEEIKCHLNNAVSYKHLSAVSINYLRKQLEQHCDKHVVTSMLDSYKPLDGHTLKFKGVKVREILINHFTRTIHIIYKDQEGEE